MLMKKYAVILFFTLLNVSLFSQIDTFSSHLPIVTIDTHGEEIIDEPKIPADMKIIYNPGQINQITDTLYDYNGKIGIELRGSSSQLFPKKPYGFKTRDEDGENIKVSLLGLPKEDTWTFNASYNDKTLMRDGLTYILAGKIMDYAPRVRYTEMFVNGEYQGIYLIIEKITRDKNRVNIAKMSKSDNEGDAVTGGYIIKIDKKTGSNSGEGWSSAYPNIQDSTSHTFFQFEYPKAKNITTQQKNYCEKYFNFIDSLILSDDYKNPVSGYRKYIDTESLIDFIIINEFTKNPDAFTFSTFFYKERDSDGGLIKFGPIWDFNIALGNVDYCPGGNPEGLVVFNIEDECLTSPHFWWRKIMEDESFYAELKQRWQDLRLHQLTEDNIMNTVDSLAQLVGEAQVRNFERWPILGEYIWPNYYVGETYEEEVAFLKNWIHDRLAFLDREWDFKGSATEEFSNIENITLVPNPVSDLVTIKSDLISTQTKIVIIDISGNVVPTRVISSENGSLILDMNGYLPGIYFIKTINDKFIKTLKVVKI